MKELEERIQRDGQVAAPRASGPQLRPLPAEMNTGRNASQLAYTLRWDQRPWLLVVLLAALLACNALPVAPSRTPTPVPSNPPAPSPTLSPTLSPDKQSATAIPEVAGTASPAGPELACKVLSQSIVNGTRFGTRQSFDISWQIQNTGTAAWDPGVVELAYAGGTRMFRSQPVPLTHSSAPGDITTLSADMVAPRAPGDYNMVWALRRGDEYFCKINVIIHARPN